MLLTLFVVIFVGYCQQIHYAALVG